MSWKAGRGYLIKTLFVKLTDLLTGVQEAMEQKKLSYVLYKMPA